MAARQLAGRRPLYFTADVSIIFFRRLILTTKYFSFQYSVTYCSQALWRQDNDPAHRARETVHLLTHKTPDFITPALWPANSPDLKLTVLTLAPSTNRFGGSCRSVCTAARFVMSTSWSKSGNFATSWSSMKRSVSGDHVFELAFERMVDILNTDFRCADVLPFARTRIWQSITPVPIVDTYAFEWPY